jgi:hypothetical protein
VEISAVTLAKNKRVLDTKGRLLAKFQPAIYFDSSVLIDYYSVAGWSLPNGKERTVARQNKHPAISALTALLKADERLQKTFEIRERLSNRKRGHGKPHAIATPLAIWELSEWHAESRFKELAFEAFGPSTVQRKSKKEIGAYFRHVFEAMEEIGPPPRTLTPLQELVFDTHGGHNTFFMSFWLDGLLEVPVVHLQKLFAWDMGVHAWAYFQLGLADIMHLLLAQQLGCEYFASYDTDFRRVKGWIEDIKILTSPEEILQVI